MSRIFLADSRRTPAGGGAAESDLPILLVEDEPVNQRVMLRIMKKLGYRLEVASDGRHALELFGSASYALVVMDCEMPILNGYETAREIRKHERGRPRIPIIAVTAHLLEDVREKILAAGMDDCVSKMDLVTRLPERLARWYPRGKTPSSKPRVASESPSSRSPARPSSRSPAIDSSVYRSEATLSVFFKHVEGQVAAVEGALQAGDEAMLRRASHKLKGSCLVVGLPKMARLCAELEQAPERPRALFAELTRELGRVRARLKPAGPESAK